MAGTRLVPPHSLAFRPEWYPRVAHPTPRLSPQRATLRRVNTRRAERSSTRSLAKPRREASRIKPTLSVRSHAAPTASPRGVSVQEPPPASAHRVDGHVSVISLHAPGLYSGPPSDYHPSPRSRSAGMKVVQAAAQQIHTEGGSDAPHGPTRLHRVSGC
jgi:hypothetical protein